MPKQSTGYSIYDFNGTGRLEIRKPPPGDHTCADDNKAVIMAKKDGFKTIPIGELPFGFPYARNYWLNTPKNRERIQRFTNKRFRQRIQNSIT